MLSLTVNAVWSVAEASEARLFVNDQDLDLQESIIFENGRLFVPIRAVAEHLNAEAEWDEENNLARVLTPLDDEITFFADQRMIKLNGIAYVMDVSSFLREGRLYLPLRHVAELMHMKAFWDESQNAALFYNVPLYTILDGDTLQSIGEAFGTEVEFLKERNHLADESLQAGDDLKVVIPQIMKEKEPHPDLLLLAKIIHAEAGYEPFDGQLAVGNVILNRVEDPRFPDTIKAVIYQRGQFTPAMNGSLERTEPNKSSIEAAEKVLNGENVVGDALYFNNPKVSGHSFFKSLETVKTIGNHRFAK